MYQHRCRYWHVTINVHRYTQTCIHSGMKMYRIYIFISIKIYPDIYYCREKGMLTFLWVNNVRQFHCLILVVHHCKVIE